MKFTVNQQSSVESWTSAREKPVPEGELHVYLQVSAFDRSKVWQAYTLVPFVQITESESVFMPHALHKEQLI